MSMKILVVILVATAYCYFAALSHLAHVATNEANAITDIYAQGSQHPEQILARY
jgi:hypothetical protein